MDIDEPGSLLGLYQGTPLNERGWGYGNQLPDKITLFQDTIEDECDGDEDEIIVAIGETLIHELGHYFGMSEAEIMDIEERYWRGEPDPAMKRKRRRSWRIRIARTRRSEGPQAVRATLSRAGVGHEGRGRRRRDQRRHRARDWPRPRGDHPAAGGPGRPRAGDRNRSRPGRRPSRPTNPTTSRWCAATSCRSTCRACSKSGSGSPPGPGHRVRVVGNLPYNISSPILFRLLDLAATTGGLSDATLMLQREVADRLTARVGTGDYGVLTILTAVHADVKRVLALPPGAFRPQPRVQSAVVRLSFRPPTVAIPDHAAFVRMVRSMFTQRRKTLLNALKPFAAERSADAGAALEAAGIDPKRRPETLTMAELAELARAFLAPGS